MITLKIEGKEELLKAFQRAPSIIEKEMNGAIRQSTEVLKQNIRREAPVFSGNLKKSIINKVQRMRGEVGVAEQAVKYGYVMEYGRRPGSRQPPSEALKPFARIKLGDESLAFVVARSIGRKGTKPTHFFQKGIDFSMPIVMRIFDLVGYKIVKEI